jgi:hypothetical protein
MAATRATLGSSTGPSQRSPRPRSLPAPERIIWIFGAPRSGTSWLAWMMRDLPRHLMWNEPYVGAMFGDFYYRHNGDDQVADFILSPRYEHLWIPCLRSLILEGAAARHPNADHQEYVVIKEPHGSIGAALLSKALPESRFVLLLRDPRDVIASNLDSQRKGSWALPLDPGRNSPRAVPAGANPDAWVRQAATNYARYMRVARDAYEAHRGPKSLIKYEDLRENTIDLVAHVYADLRIDVSQREFVRVVEAHAWERVPAHKKGPKKFFRKAVVGAWRDDLTREQVSIIEEIAAGVLDEFY